MKWTKAQSEAINIPVSDIIVSAAAGSGKTAVMAERIITRLTGVSKIDVDKILVVTYTNAAASEIKERVMKKIVEKLECGGDDGLQKQLVLLSNSHFCTIHSFCLELIRKYFYLLDIDPNVKTGDTTDLELLLWESAMKVVSGYHDNDDADFTGLLQMYGTSKEDKLAKLILDIYKFSRTMPDSEEWLDSLADNYKAFPAKCMDYLYEYGISALQMAVAECNKAISMISENDTCLKWLPAISAEYDMLKEALLLSNSYETLYRAVQNINFDSLPRTKTEGDERVKKEIKLCRDNYKDIIKKKISEAYISLSPDDIKNDNRFVYPYVLKLIELTKKVGLEYAGMKKERNVIDFSDYEHFALSLLKNSDGTPSDVALAVSRDFEEIYIDEYQDCNNIQNEIFSCISGSVRNKPNIFCVGDMKQSIYKFRDANPMNFRKKCDEAFLYDGLNVNSSNKIFLNSNFRSRKSILDYVNTVFSQIMSDRCGELNYDDNEKLYYGGGFEEVNPDINKIDIDIISENDDFGDFIYDDEEKLSKTEAELCHIAKKIRSYIDDGYMLYDKKNGVSRSAKYSDIVILMRSPRSFSEEAQSIFKKYDIPLYMDNSSGYFETEEIAFLLSFLKIVDNPDDDIALVAVMKNPVFSFNENELLRIRLHMDNSSFYSCVNNYILKNEDKLSLKLRDFIAVIEDLHTKSRYMLTDEFLSYLLDKTNYMVYLSAFADGALKKSNVNFLLYKAMEFEKDNYRGISSFVRYVENIAEDDSAECAVISNPDNNVVRLMSIHKSKGLEFPIVFLSGLGKQYNMMDSRGGHVLHKSFGIGLDFIDTQKAYKIPTINKLAIKQKIKDEAISEELRVLYVALTRPVEKLICTAVVKNASKLLNDTERTLSLCDYQINPYIVLSKNSFIETILLASMRSLGFESGGYTQFKCSVDDNVCYNLSFINISDIHFDVSVADNKMCDEFVWEYDDKENLTQALDYKYPFSDSTTLPANITVTEIKRLGMHQDEEHNYFNDTKLATPVFFHTDTSIRGASMGSLIHLCMERLDLHSLTSDKLLDEALHKLHAASAITMEQMESIDRNKLRMFSKSDIFKRMSDNLGSLKKEYAFHYMTHLSDVFDTGSEDMLMIQGVVDAYFVDSDGDIVLVDYKTDKVINGNVASVVDRYRIQLDSYAKALQTIHKKRVKEKIIYLFDVNEEVSL